MDDLKRADFLVIIKLHTLWQPCLTEPLAAVARTAQGSAFCNTCSLLALSGKYGNIIAISYTPIFPTNDSKAGM